MHPVLIEIGPFILRWYGVMIAAACMVGLWVAKKEAKRKAIKPELIENFFLIAFAVSIIGARFYYIAFSAPSLFWKNPLAVLAIWKGGLAIHGAILGGLLTAIVYTWKTRQSFWKFGDTLVPSLALGQAIGRIGCFLNGDAHGYPTDMPWGMVFSSQSPAGQMFPGQPLHPTQLYEMIFNLIIFAVLWNFRKKIKPDGVLFAAYIFMYSSARIIVEAFRADQLTYLGGISAAQSIGVIGIIVAVMLIVMRNKNGVKIS